MTPVERQVATLAAREAELRLKRRESDPGARVLADWLARERQRLELRMEHPEPPDRLTRNLFGETE